MSKRPETGDRGPETVEPRLTPVADPSPVFGHRSSLMSDGMTLTLSIVRDLGSIAAL